MTLTSINVDALAWNTLTSPMTMVKRYVFLISAFSWYFHSNLFHFFRMVEIVPVMSTANAEWCVNVVRQICEICTILSR